MALASYDDLIAQIPIWAMKPTDPEFLAVVPDLIRLVEDDLNGNDKFRIQFMEVRQRRDTEGSKVLYGLPSNQCGISALTIYSNPTRQLEYMSADVLQSKWNDTTSGVPHNYTLIGDELKLGPAPDGEYPMELVCHVYILPKQPADPAGDWYALEPTNQTNWLVLKHPSVYLHGAMALGGAFHKDPTRTQLHAPLYQRAVDGIIRANRRRHLGTPRQVGLVGATP